MKYLILLLLIISSFQVGAQSDSISEDSNFSEKFKYWVNPVEGQTNTFFTGSLNYMYTLNGEFLKGGRGTHVSFGFNAARIVNRKIVLGVTVDIKGAKGLFNNYTTSSALRDNFNANFISDYNDPADSARAYVLHDAMNNTDNKSFYGNYFSHIGIMFSPFPEKYGGLMLVVKKGFYTFTVDGAHHDNPYYDTHGSDFADFRVPMPLSIELRMKPTTFFKSLQTDKYDMSLNHLVHLSFFYERQSYVDAKLQGLSINQIVQQPFLDKYGIDEHIGFRLRIGIY